MNIVNKVFINGLVAPSTAAGVNSALAKRW